MKLGALPVSTNQPINSITVGTAVLSKNLDTIEKAGQSLIKMMELSVSPNLGSNIDIRV